MSRVGKKLIDVPKAIEVKIQGDLVSVKGPKGSLSLNLHPLISANFENNQIKVAVKKIENKKQMAVWGLYRNLIKNMVLGVEQGFSKQLEITGVGFKAAVVKDTLTLNVGYSHQVDFKIPAGIEITVNKNIINVAGADKQMVGQVAAEIRAIKKPEPYKGKGIKYSYEVIRKKAGKAAVKTE